MTSPTKPAEPGIGMRLALDLGPLAIYFATYAATKHDIFISTAVFMGVTAVAMLVSLIRFGKVSPIQIFSAIMVLILGGLTIWLHKDWIIKMKPTFYYSLVSGLLFFGLASGRPLLQQVLGSTYPGLDQDGWKKLTRNWAIFFAFMAALNEAVWRNSSTDFWVGFKLWGALPLTFLFAAANIPMLLKHGLMKEDAVPAEQGPVE